MERRFVFLLLERARHEFQVLEFFLGHDPTSIIEQKLEVGIF